MFIPHSSSGPYSGVPLGGMGGGNIGRGYRGDFRRWSLFPGKYNHTVVHTDVFCIRIKTAAGDVYSKVLSCFDGKESEGLSSWDWGVSKESVTYHGLFPRAWTVYLDPVPGVTVTVRQVSPFLPGAYSETSLPACCFHVDVTNTGYSQEVEVSIMFCFENGNEIDLPAAFSDRSVEIMHSPFSIVSDSSSTAMRFTGVCMANTKYTKVTVDRDRGLCDWSGVPDSLQFLDQGSFSIAALEQEQAVVSFTDMFYVTNPGSNSSAGIVLPDTIWRAFTTTGDLTNTIASAVHQAVCSSDGRRVASALCQRKRVAAGSTSSFSFSLSWDNPVARFGSGMSLPRYYTRFFGDSGLCSPSIASYALAHSTDWERRIVYWQREVQDNESLPEYYKSQLFNELYFLCDGGVVWTDSSNGCPNVIKGSRLKNYTTYYADGEFARSTVDSPVGSARIHRDLSSSSSLSVVDFIDNLASQRVLKVAQATLLDHDKKVSECDGNQSLVGQFLYLEGHEYLMYNTYDVHFYSGFALLMLFPQLELSLQYDFARAVRQSDDTERILLGTHGFSNIIGPFCSMALWDTHAFSGSRRMKTVTEIANDAEQEEDRLAPKESRSSSGASPTNAHKSGIRPRKVQGTVPHDLGSPSEAPWFKTNIYNFQDVSNWKDLGPKFVLQIYRDYVHTKSTKFLRDVYPVVVKVMSRTEEFDTDDDGMIENSGFPDQTYDIWTATGVHAYSGGLWLAACMAMVEMAKSMNESTTSLYYADIVERGRKAYISALWNGKYFNYDSSTAGHHDSIMADMLAGQWYADACKLGRIVPADMVHSSLRAIFENNVLKFGRDRLLGAVNGTRPDTGAVDSSCLQSREVWTGTTYALAALLLHEGIDQQEEEKATSSDCDVSEEDSRIMDSKVRVGFVTESAKSFLSMGFTTAKGIHDAGWQEFGYQFATPEAWEQSGNFRSQGYMRPLSIWAMQFALQSKIDSFDTA